MCAAFAAALIAKALKMTNERAKAENTAATTELNDTLHRGNDALSRAADADSAAFVSFLGALALPKSTDDEKAIRREALAQAALAAAAVPIDAAENILAMLNAADSVARIVRMQFLDDIRASVDLLRGAGSAALRSFDANLPSLKNSENSLRLAARRSYLSEAIEQSAAKVHSIASRRIAESSGR
jgi:formiminotetrahydrofolate cyclodeaminase